MIGIRRSQGVSTIVKTARRLLGGLAVAAAALLPLLGAGTAEAAPASGRSDMALSTITRVISGPDAAGKDRVALSSGQTITLPATVVTQARHLSGGSTAPGGVTTQNAVSGTCGSSYIFLYERSGGTPVRMVTGFNLSGGRRAISYGWGAEIIGPSGSGYQYEYGAGGSLAFRTGWQGSHNSGKAYARGEYFAYVFSDSYALLDNGSICTSEEPSQETFL